MKPTKVHQIYESKPNARISRRVGEWMASVKVEHEKDGTEYRLWNSKRQNDLFVGHHFPGWYEQYKALPFDIQRWDILRLMILYIEGGIYIDTDVECYKSTLPLISDIECQCAFGLEPQVHADDLRMPFLVGSYFIATEQKNNAIHKLIEFLFTRAKVNWSTHLPTQVMRSTGPFAITEFWQMQSSLFPVNLIDSRYLSPIAAKDVPAYLLGKYFTGVEEANIVHLYSSSWAKPIENKEELEREDFLRWKLSKDK